MSIDYNDVGAFNEGISEREAYIHSMYWVALASMQGLGKTYADKLVGDIRGFADKLYPPSEEK